MNTSMKRTEVLAAHMKSSGQVSVGVRANETASRVGTFNGQRLEASYDYIVVGAGSAGCVVAARLSENPKNSVLLLEAGDTNQTFAVRSPMITCADLQNSDKDWAFRSEPVPGAGGRVSNWPRGKTLGGCSSINFMLYVRGDPRNYDYWATHCGCPGWSYDDVLPWFKKSETFVGAKGHKESHGSSGELHVTPMAEQSYVTGQTLDAFVNGCRECGLASTEDVNGPIQEGAMRSQCSINNGVRDDAATAFLFATGAMYDRKNLTVVTLAHVTKVTTQGNVATGVVFRQGSLDTLKLSTADSISVEARKEVILTAGAVQTPQIMLLSGIGPRKEIEKHDIPLVLDSPGVGQSMEDHLMVPVFFGMRPGKTNGFHDKSPMDLVSNLTKYLLLGKDLMCTSWVEAMCFLQSKQEDIYETPQNDLQVHVVPFIPHEDDLFESAFGFDKTVHGSIVQPSKHPAHGVTILPSLVLPKSQGSITLRSADPLAPPVITPGYLSHPRDVEALADCYAFVREVATSKSMKSLGIGAEIKDETINHPLESRAYLIERCRAGAITIYHPTSTARMGDPSDEMSVCDPQMRVYGIQNLRVGDASIFPHVMSGNTNAPAIMAGERCADFILKSK